jgi:MFS family permease
MKGFKSYYSVLLATTTASFLTPFTTSSIAIALPVMALEFNVDLANVNWVVNAFLITLASTVFVIGRVSDWLGRGRMFTLGITVFTITSLATSLARSYVDVIICRSLQGIAAAMISSTAVAILSEELPKWKRGIGIGVNTTAVYLGLSLGPLVSGYLINYFGWRSLFTLKTIISLMSLVITVRTIKLRRSSTSRPNIPISILIISSIAMIIYGTSNISNLYGIIVASFGGTLLVTTFLVERSSHRVLHPSLLKKSVLAANTAALLNYSATYALTVLLSTYLQKLRGLPPSDTGLILTTQPILQVLLSPIAGLLADRYDPSILATIGMTTITAGIYNLIFINYETPITYLIYMLIVLGIGFAFFASPNTTAVMNMSSREAYGSATALLATMRFLGQALSISVITSIMTIQRDLMTAIKTSLMIYVTLSIIGTILSLIPRFNRE